jgi:capsular polysaccharide biosynthesis protein
MVLIPGTGVNGKGFANPTGAGSRLDGADAHGEVLTFKELVQVVRRRLWMILLLALLMSGAAMTYSLLLQTPKYEATIRILVRQTAGNPESRSSLGDEVQGLLQLTGTMAEAVDARSVAERVISDLNLATTPQEFSLNLSAQQVPETQFIEVTYADTNPARAQQVANTTGDEFAKMVSEVGPSANAVAATVWERAELPEAPASPRPLLYGLLAFSFGALLGVSLAFLLEYLDDSWRSAEEVERVSGLDVLGTIPWAGTPSRWHRDGG